MTTETKAVTGEFITIAGERFYAIRNVDRMPPFFISLVSDHDSWLFIASNGGLTAGRESPDKAVFPYVTVDKIYDGASSTGSKTLVRVRDQGKTRHWEPFNPEHDARHAVTRNLYKNAVGNQLIFEEINHDLDLAFRYRWSASDEFGLVRSASIENLGNAAVAVDVIDGLQNILPAGTPRFAQTNTSYLVDAYKWTELDAATGVAMFTLFSAISDRAEPRESLRSTTAFCVGLDSFEVLLSTDQLSAFRRDDEVQQETRTRGVRGAYLVSTAFELAAGATSKWHQVIDAEQSQADAVALLQRVQEQGNQLYDVIEQSIAASTDGLARIIAAADGFQHTAEENVSTHHYANVLFNVLRGGIPDDQYQIDKADFLGHVQHFNRAVYERHQSLLDSLDDRIHITALRDRLQQADDPQLQRLAWEYLPITFGRRHGDPSRPWNQFAIRLKDEHGRHLLSYEGNWRDIFQNWEALLLSYPEFTESIIAKFVNASTADGYNPYRITNLGIDWEVEDPDDPWSYIGYWGDHQLIYLQKLLELSQQFHPQQLQAMLHERLFCYANVPYRIKAFDALVKDAKNTINYDDAAAQAIEKRVAEIGADGKLIADGDQVYQVTLLEKLLVPLLAKLGNLVVGGGIWLNTQRPEWNDANNALVGHGLSMVTLYYMRRYLQFLQQLLEEGAGSAELSNEVSRWLHDSAMALANSRELLQSGVIDDRQRYRLLAALGRAASDYRDSIYSSEPFSGRRRVEIKVVRGLIDDALAAVDASIRENRRDDGLYHAYNLVHFDDDRASVRHLYNMLEGQVAALSSGAVEPGDAVTLLDSLFDSNLYREDQASFLLYPDRELPGYLEKNVIPAEFMENQPLLMQMLEQGDHRLVQRDARGDYRFSSGLVNAAALDARIDMLAKDYGTKITDLRAALRKTYEVVFDHKAFTGRSGGMFGFEGLGSIYWHMVSKLLVAVQEVFFAARDADADQAVLRRLAQHYYRVRDGIGFNKTPLQYGAFPTDPYSHTPGHAGAQQPGMTGQVKEEILTRFG
ncbi:MAG: hypothetical protein HKN49_11830, partial [Gammaproteobacteria bacterium]|nr:hypothetical protein [Gammaproteobacteria bacterium]